jgi:serine/threonine protein phosphatase 1
MAERIGPCMLGRWLVQVSSASRPGTVPASQAVYAVGDIHGRLDLLDEVLQLILDDAARHAADDMGRSIVFLGDYIDRGPASHDVVERLLRRPLAGFDCVYLMGNHEQALLSFLGGADNGLDWLSFGGVETLRSYGVALRVLPRSERGMEELRAEAMAAIPEDHLAFFERCGLFHCIGDYVFVHAGVRPGVALDRQKPADLMWIRDDFLRARVPLSGQVVVHGHTIVDRPENRTHRINIDTGAFASGRLTCLALRQSERRFISTMGS